MCLKQSDFDDAHDLTQACPGCRAMREGMSAVCRAGMEEVLQGTAKGQQRLEEAERRTRDTAGERTAKRSKSRELQQCTSPSSSSASPSDAFAGGDATNVVAGGVARDAGKVVAACVAQDAVQDTVMSEG